MCVLKPLAALALLAGTLWVGSAAAQVQRSGGAANAALMQQYQQAVAERGQLQADNEKLKKANDDLRRQLETAKQQLATTKAGVTRHEAALATAQASNESNAKALTDTRAKMQELISRFRETVTQLRAVESDRTQLQQQLTQSKAAFDKCAQRNYELYQVSNEVLDRYAHQGAFSYLARAEPFTRIKRTEIDNLVLEYRERAEELRVKPNATAPSGATAPVSATPAPTTPSPAGAPGPGTPSPATEAAPNPQGAPANPDEGRGTSSPL
jgi:cell division septum initiation protein DivIVA